MREDSRNMRSVPKGWLLQLSIILGSLTGSSSLILQHTHNESLHAAEIFPPPLFAKPKQPEPHVSEDRVFIVVLGHGQEESNGSGTEECRVKALS
eukprot:2607467-Amphidinium_carterae.1